MEMLRGMANTATKLATGDPADVSSPTGSRLDSFLTSLVQYPFLALAATNTGSRTGRSPVTTAAQKLVRAVAGREPTGSTVGSASRPGDQSLADFDEGKAILQLERWCHEPVLTGSLDDTMFKAREWLLSAMEWQREDLNRLCAETPELSDLASSNDKILAGSVSQLPSTVQTKVWKLQGLQTLVKALDWRLGARPPALSLDQIVAAHLAMSAGQQGTPVVSHRVKPAGPPAPHDEAPAGAPRAAEQQDMAAVPSPADTPMTALVADVNPNVRHITNELQHKYALSRGRTLMEVANVLLGVVRMWLSAVALGCYLFATALRILGNGLSALGGLVAFTVVLSVALSVVSALTFLGASASEATGTFLSYMARFTDLAKRRTRTRGLGPQIVMDKLGPLSLGKVSFEDLEDFFCQQVVPYPASALQGGGRPLPAGLSAALHHGVEGAQGLAGLRNRPDIPRLGHDPLLVTCYDAGIVDSNGALQPHVSAEVVAEHFDPSGFFGRASGLTRKAGAVLLLRLLAWKQIASIMAPPAVAGGTSEAERALRYVFIAGVRGAGASTLYRTLVGLPQEYQMTGAGQGVELRQILRHRSSYALLCKGQEGATNGVSWVTQPSHGVVSCLVFLVPADVFPHHLGLSMDANQPSAVARELDNVWQVLALRRPVLFAVTKASTIKGRLQAEAGSEGMLLAWRNALKDEAHRRGLEPEQITVVLTELTGTPPPGAVGTLQLQDWLLQALASAPQQR